MITTCAGLRHKELNTSADYVYMFTAALRDAEILCESRPKQILDVFKLLMMCILIWSAEWS